MEIDRDFKFGSSETEYFYRENKEAFDEVFTAIVMLIDGTSTGELESLLGTDILTEMEENILVQGSGDENPIVKASDELAELVAFKTIEILRQLRDPTYPEKITVVKKEELDDSAQDS